MFSTASELVEIHGYSDEGYYEDPITKEPVSIENLLLITEIINGVIHKYAYDINTLLEYFNIPSTPRINLFNNQILSPQQITEIRQFAATKNLDLMK